MDINGVSQIISNLGFPIAVCVALFWYLMRENDAHKEETEKLREALENNTLIITKLYERLGGGDK
jgi:preprotein translocase subunit YajC